jgi:hypothetical protein
VIDVLERSFNSLENKNSEFCKRYLIESVKEKINDECGNCSVGGQPKYRAASESRIQRTENNETEIFFDDDSFRSPDHIVTESSETKP